MRLQLFKKTIQLSETAQIKIQVRIIKHNPIDNKPGSQLFVSKTCGDQVSYTTDQIMHGTGEK